MSGASDFLENALGHRPADPALFEQALTHGSHGGASYERLEFLGDRVLGLVVADWLYERFPDEPEGMMSRRYNALVARETCAEVGRAIGVPAEIRLGRQAREDRATGSDNVVGDVVEALIGALYLDSGLAPAAAFIRKNWAPFLDSQRQAPQHPKSALQELAAARNWGTPHYQLLARSGAHHAPTFRVQVTVRGGGEAEAEGPSKQDAETAAAEALLGELATPNRPA
ncbi:ribonuclease III [Sphingomonas mesophila]|uniref:ribonuclease III n=1 Tax=Sphingomonas mesophila TaxID=2303576 RepID=UPI001F072C98|nr:ribonuclease III [Sphingomonas mesophila]